MPGVPSGRGCEACRKQKKKCDQTQPSCARCARLNIPCVGGGVRRFKFMDQGVVVKLAVDRKKNPLPPRTRSPTPQFLPSSQTDAIANAFVCMMEVTDVRYDISCYGAFLKQVPSRLGNSPVLDASVTALTHASAALYTRQDHAEVFQKYGHGLSVLRTALSNAHESHSADTLCAIYFLMIAEGWIMKKYDVSVKHVSGMAYVLNILAAKNDPDPFEQDLLRTLCIPVILSNILDPTIQLPVSVMRRISVAGPRRPISNQRAPIQSLHVTTFAKFPGLVHHPELHFSDLVETYQQMRLEYSTLRRRLDTAAVDIAAEANRVPSLEAMRLQSLCQVGCCLILTLAIILNRVYHTCNPLEPSLDDDLHHFCRESFTLAEAALPHRPLGSSPIPLNLTIAWAVVRDADLRDQIEGMIEMYEGNYIKTPWKGSAFLLQQRLKQLRLRMASLQPLENSPRTDSSSSSATPS